MTKYAALLSLFLATPALQAGEPWKMHLRSETEKIDLRIDLYEESIEVPGLEAFGPMHGYMNGDIYGVWYVTGAEIKDDRTATVSIANDLGSEDQKLTLTQISDSTWLLKFVGYNAVKRVQGKKLVKIPAEFPMKIKN